MNKSDFTDEELEMYPAWFLRAVVHLMFGLSMLVFMGAIALIVRLL